MEPEKSSISTTPRMTLDTPTAKVNGQSRGIKEVWKEFMSETSLHGCKHVLMRRQMIGACIMWVVLLGFMGCSLGYTLVGLWLTYKEYPVKTVWSSRMEKSITLPAFTFCLGSNMDMQKLKNSNSSLLFDYVTKTHSFDPFDSFFRNESDMDEYIRRMDEVVGDMSMREFSKLTGFDVRDVFIRLLNETHVIPEIEWDSWLRVLPNPKQACWTLNWDHTREVKFGTRNKLTILLDLKTDRYPPGIIYSGIDFNVHDGQSSHYSESTYFIPSGSFVHAYFKRTERRYLPSPYNSFGDDGCIDVESDVYKPLKMFSKYTRMACLLEFSVTDAIESCKCVEPGFAQPFPNVSECSFKKMETCVKPIYYSSFELAVASKEVGCPQECSYSTYQLTMSTTKFPLTDIPSLGYSTAYGRENLVLMNIAATDTWVGLEEHVPELTILSIFGTVGGYMGLFLGASLLTLTECFEALLICLWLLVAKAKVALVRS